MNIQQIIEVLEGARKYSRPAEFSPGAFKAIEYRLNTAIENLRTLQQLEGMTATQEQSDWVLMPKHLTDDMVRGGVSAVLGGGIHSEIAEVFDDCLGPELETLYQSLIEARPQ